MTKEEYQINLIRMWDSVRSTHKGQKDCIGVNCKDCPFDGNLCNMYDAIEVVENWTREHPIKTNSDKFREVFGVDAPMNKCIKNYDSCVDCEYYEFGSEHGGCKVDERFWEAEYTEPAESEE